MNPDHPAIAGIVEQNFCTSKNGLISLIV